MSVVVGVMATGSPLGGWLASFGLERYEAVFKDNDIDLEVIADLNDADLERLGITLGHRKKLLRAIAALTSGQPRSTLAIEKAEPSQVIIKPVQSGAERRHLTVLFCDLVGSTALSARLDPEEMREVLIAYHSCVAEVIRRFEGFIAKYMGDGVLIYFGYPTAHENEASRAIRAALALVEAVTRLKCKPDLQSLEIRIGISSGLVVVGDLIGEGSAQELAVVGDTPNLAARLQSLAQPNTIVISSGTRRLIGSEFDLEELAPQMVKGLAESVLTWRVLGVSTVESRFEAHTRGPTLMVGREHEIALVLSRWQQACEGEGQVVMISGEPGIGKSRMIRAVLEQVEDHPHIHVRNQCSPYHVDTAFHPIIDQLERAAAIERDDPNFVKLHKLETLLARGTNQVEQVAPLIATLLSIPFEGRYPALTYSPQRQKDLTIEALVGQLAGLARDQPVLTIFEDVHWADPTTLEVLEQLIDRIATARVLLIVTFRPEFVPPWKTRSHVTAHSLTRLSRRQSTALIAKVTGGKDLPVEVLEQVISKTDGVPLFLEELTKTVLEAGILREVDGQYELVGPLPPLAIPSTLQDSLMARLDRQAPVKEVAQLAAVIGRDFSFELLAAVSQLGEAKLQQALAQLVSSELVFVRGRPPEANYSFKHALVQDAAYSSLLKSKRQFCHARIAAALEERWSEAKNTQPEVLAHHYTSAGLIEQAIPCWIRASQRAQESAALDGAIRHIRRALDLVEALPPGLSRDHLEVASRVVLGTTYMIFVGPPSLEVRRVLEPAFEICTRLNDVDVEKKVRVIWGLTLHHAVRSEYPQALELAEALIALGSNEAGSYPELLGHSMRSFIYHCMGEHAAAKQDVDHLWKIYVPERHDFLVNLLNFHPMALAQVFRAHSLWMTGYPDESVAVAERTLGEAHQLGHIFNLSWVNIMCSAVFMFRREPELQIALLEKGRTLAEDHGIDFLSDFLVWWAADSYIQLGNHEQAKELAAMGSRVYPAMGGQHTVPYMKAIHARALAQLGCLEEATSKIEEALDNADQTDEREHEPEILRIRGEILHKKGQLDEAEEIFVQSLSLARAQQAKGWELRTSLSLADLWRERGKLQSARELLEPIYSWFKEGFDTADLREAKMLLQDLTEPRPQDSRIANVTG